MSETASVSELTPEQAFEEQLQAWAELFNLMQTSDLLDVDPPESAMVLQELGLLDDPEADILLTGTLEARAELIAKKSQEIVERYQPFAGTPLSIFHEKDLGKKDRRPITGTFSRLRVVDDSVIIDLEAGETGQPSSWLVHPHVVITVAG